MSILLWIIILVVIYSDYALTGYIETVYINGCASCTLYLTCRHLPSVIAILDAEFTFENDNSTNSFGETIVSDGTATQIHLRKTLNKRCSGVHHCSFILLDDYPSARKWKVGNLTIKYSCVSEDKIYKYCNSDIIIPYSNAIQKSFEGFIHNPGYPRFYTTSHGQCRWKIEASDEQQIEVTVLDIAFSGYNSNLECFNEQLKIFDPSTQVSHQVCQLQPQLKVLSNGNSLEIILSSTYSLLPLRGFLLYYKVVGCPTPSKPKDGYLVYRNKSFAEYRCCVGYKFPNGQRIMILQCLGAYWNEILPLPNCQSITKELFTLKKSIPTSNMASDILAPALLIITLFLINFVVLFYIHRMKQKHTVVIEDEELGTLKRNDTNSP